MPIFSTNISRCFVYRQKSFVEKNQAVIAGVQRGGLGRHSFDVISVSVDFRFQVKVSAEKKREAYCLASDIQLYSVRVITTYVCSKKKTSKLIDFNLFSNITDKEVKCICGRKLTLQWCSVLEATFTRC